MFNTVIAFRALRRSLPALDRPPAGGRVWAGLRAERGASLIEYALLVALIAVVCIGAVAFFGGQTADVYSGAGSSFN